MGTKCFIFYIFKMLQRQRVSGWRFDILTACLCVQLNYTKLEKSTWGQY